MAHKGEERPGIRFLLSFLRVLEPKFRCGLKPSSRLLLSGDLGPSPEIHEELPPPAEVLDLFNNPVGYFTSLAKCSAFCCF
jgi:hypothetical protein